MSNGKATASFFENGSTTQFEYCYKLYPEVLKMKAEKRSKKPQELIRLDQWFQNELPGLIKARGKDAHLVYDELVQAMKWKQSRGKFYPQLSYLVKVNTPRAVVQETKKAFRKLPNLEQAITALSNLKGVGTTMASALLTAAAPDSAPFMADECLMAIPEIEGIDYTTKEYLNFVQHIQATVERLNVEVGGDTPHWSPHRVELALWAHYVANDLSPQLLDDMPSPGTQIQANGSCSKSKDLVDAGDDTNDTNDAVALDVDEEESLGAGGGRHAVVTNKPNNNNINNNNTANTLLQDGDSNFVSNDSNSQEPIIDDNTTQTTATTTSSTSAEESEAMTAGHVAAVGDVAAAGADAESNQEAPHKTAAAAATAAHNNSSGGGKQLNNNGAAAAAGTGAASVAAGTVAANGNGTAAGNGATAAAASLPAPEDDEEDDDEEEDDEDEEEDEDEDIDDEDDEDDELEADESNSSSNNVRAAAAANNKLQQLTVAAATAAAAAPSIGQKRTALHCDMEAANNANSAAAAAVAATADKTASPPELKKLRSD